MIGDIRAITVSALVPRSARISVAIFFRNRLIAALLGFGQQLDAVAADGEPQEIEPLGEGDDPGLVFIEGETPGVQPIRELGLDLVRLFTRIA